MKNPSKRLIWLAIFALWACGTQIKNYPTLVNAGILGLSTTDPYLGANLFLASELERSSYLFNFFKSKGAPAAIEIVEKSFKPTHLILYYPLERQAYAADLIKSATRREWVVRGPFAIEREDFRTLMRMQGALSGEPVFMLWGKPFRFRFEPSPERALKPEIPLVPTSKPMPTKKPKLIVMKKNVPTPPPAATPTVAIDRPLSFDQQALLMAKDFAERALNGDLIHTVKSDKESFEAIVQWYTGSLEGKDAVLSANGLPPETQTLSKGMRIRIPAELVKERRVMPPR